MTLAIDPGPQTPIELGAFLAAMETRGFDPDDQAAYAEAAPLLAALSANRAFLGDLLIKTLKDRAAGQERENGYGPQVLLLHRGPGWFVCANLWPEATDALVRASGPERFFYGIPHDHNFSFLTVGHFGPGYWSDYYEHDGDFIGVPGEPVSLRFIERAQLGEGRVALYRAHRDIHSQLPPESLSVSLNIVQGTAGRFPRSVSLRCGARANRRATGAKSAGASARLSRNLGGRGGARSARSFRHAAPERTYPFRSNPRDGRCRTGSGASASDPRTRGGRWQCAGGGIGAHPIEVLRNGVISAHVRRAGRHCVDVRICVEGGNADQRAAIVRALGVLGCECVETGDLRISIAPSLELDVVAGIAIVDSRRVRLTRIELALLGCLITAPGPIKRPALIARVWGYGFDPGTNIVAVHVSRLRAKLGPAFTVSYREGYRIEAAPSLLVPARSPQSRTPARQCS